MKKPDQIPEQTKKKTVKALVKGKSPHTEELVDHYWGSINYVFSLIKASEIKAGLILSFYGILLNIAYQNIAMVLEDQVSNVFIFVLLGGWMICTIISIYFSVRCFIPKIEAQYDPNIFFFGDIISKFGTIREFSQTFYNISLKEKELFDQLGQQIFIISKISAYKFKCVNLAIRFLAAGLFALLGASIVYTLLKFVFT